MMRVTAGGGAAEATDAGPARMAAVPGSKRGELEKLARSLEGFFVRFLMESMRKTVKKNELFSGGQGEEVFSGLFDAEIAERASRRGKGLGIARMIVERYSRHVRDAEGSEEGGFRAEG